MRTRFTMEELGARRASTALVRIEDTTFIADVVRRPVMWRLIVLDEIWTGVVCAAVEFHKTIALSQSSIDLHACHLLGWNASELGL